MAWTQNENKEKSSGLPPPRPHAHQARKLTPTQCVSSSTSLTPMLS
jgi:hypothetical protein